MQNLQMIAKECLEEVEKAGIQIGTIKGFTVNNRAKTRYGQCRKNRIDGTYSINISGFLLEDNVPIISIKNTVIHEILHTCKNCMNHGNEWKRQANIMNKKYGYNIKRCTSFEDKGIENQRVKQAKYVITCKRCGETFYRTRKCDLTEHTNMYSCGCGGKFECKRI